ncbi:glycosyltransferase [Candidatus Woesearchaeota archaeon]|nr:glycosyltransferase [Candidatus Woesearchaeota archaeon]
MVELSIVIITKNEEKNLPRLLRSIEKQNYSDYEVIVSDAKSIDNTRKIARSFGCRVVNGGLPSIGRNNGANAANGNIILFLDADSVLTKDFLRKNLKEFKSRNLDIAGCFIIPESKNKIDIINYSTYNIFLGVVQYFYPHMPGFCIFSKTKLHHKVNGFDSGIILAEDIEYIQRAAKYGKFRMLNSKKIISSVRRFEKEGRFISVIKCIRIFLYRVFRGELRKKVIEYEFDHYRK